MSRKKFISRKTFKIKHIILYSLLCFFLLGIGFSNLVSDLGIGGNVSVLKYKPLFTITLDNQSATTSGTTSIYQKYSVGYFLDNNLQNQMTTSNNPITVPTRTGYLFGGYYTGTNGSGTQYIDSTGKLTSNASNTHFTANDTLYAAWTRVMAENLSFDNTITNFNCTDVQCALEALKNYVS